MSENERSQLQKLQWVSGIRCGFLFIITIFIVHYIQIIIVMRILLTMDTYYYILQSIYNFTVDSRHLKESIERAEFSLQLELWFTEQNGSANSLTLASTRTLQLNFHPGRGLHYHLPVLFDYFHLAACSKKLEGLDK
uniref:Uncharacterized protein n=1 Tax=Glossina palpalis gambiensis TaxID=67801 RepID=A0A1B0AZ39_9MUSC